MQNVRSNPLSDAELIHYREHGWVALGRVMDDVTLAEIRGEEARLRGDTAGQLTVFRSQCAHYSEPVRRYITNGPQVNLASQLVRSPDLAIWFNQFVTKLPDANSGKSEFPWHQDNGYVAIEPATNVTIWVALDDVNVNNGCVWLMPDSHKNGLLEHKMTSPDSWHLSLNVAGDGIPAILNAGEAVAFTGLTLHRSKFNHTANPRRAFFMEYTDVACTYRRGDLQPQPVIGERNTWVVRGQAPWPEVEKG